MFTNSLVLLVIQKSKFTAEVARTKNSYGMCLKGIVQSFSITKLGQSQETDLKKKGQNHITLHFLVWIKTMDPTFPIMQPNSVFH